MKEHHEKTEQRFLEGKSDESIGFCSEVFSAKGSGQGQVGCVIAALPVSGLQNASIDCEVVFQQKTGYQAEAAVVETVDDVLKKWTCDEI